MLALPSLASQPWLAPAAFPHAPLLQLAAQVDELAVADLDLVKAFDTENSANAAFASDRPSVQWLSMPAMPSPAVAPSMRLVDALETAAQAPLSARVASASGGAVTEELDTWLEMLAARTGRLHRDADAYMTPGAAHGRSSASLGWHIDDVDVLLIMLRGSKRFRVSGAEVGSAVGIDHMMCSGDAIYIPALCFHSGGDSGPAAAVDAEPSTMLSVAMPPRDERATEVVGEWRRTRDSLRQRLPRAECNCWQWAGGAEGARVVSRTLRGNPSWRRFCLEQDGEKTL